jgi:hypothetical protein
MLMTRNLRVTSAPLFLMERVQAVRELGPQGQLDSRFRGSDE